MPHLNESQIKNVFVGSVCTLTFACEEFLAKIAEIEWIALQKRIEKA
jgi:hypothetical protein